MNRIFRFALALAVGVAVLSTDIDASPRASNSDTRVANAPTPRISTARKVAKPADATRAAIVPSSAAPRMAISLPVCTPWMGCYPAYFYWEDVQVIADQGYIEIGWDGSWGAGPYWFDGPAPEPIDEGGGGGYGCGDERDVMIAEYAEKAANGNPYTPGCSDFSSSGSTDHFQFSELQGQDGNPHQTWGIVRSSLWTGLENTRVAWSGPLIVESGYRCAKEYARISALAPYTSRHMNGEAVDLKTPGWVNNTNDAYYLWTMLSVVASEQGAANIESWGASNGSHLHAEWLQ